MSNDRVVMEEAANARKIGTPRDGAAIEITGLLYSTLKWAAEINTQGVYKWDSVKTSEGKVVKLTEWAGLIKKNFEKLYYIPKDPKDDGKYAVKPELVNRRGIYKDVYGGGKEYEDYQLRPNFAITMTVAPDLFVPEHALGCLRLADEVLRGPTGMATLE